MIRDAGWLVQLLGGFEAGNLAVDSSTCLYGYVSKTPNQSHTLAKSFWVASKLHIISMLSMNCARPTRYPSPMVYCMCLLHEILITDPMPFC